MSLPADTPRLTFRRWRSDDYALAELLWGDPEVTRYTGGPLDEEAIRRRRERHLEYDRIAGVQYWPMFLRESGEFVGCCGLRAPEDGMYEHGFHLRREFWGRGLAYEAASAVLAYAFEVLGAKGVWGGHHPENKVSKRLLLKLGMRYTHDEYFGPTQLLHHAYTITADEWSALQKTSSTATDVARGIE